MTKIQERFDTNPHPSAPNLTVIKSQEPRLVVVKGLVMNRRQQLVAGTTDLSNGFQPASFSFVLPFIRKEPRYVDLSLNPMNTFASQGAHSCPDCENLVLDFRQHRDENQLRRFRSIEWVQGRVPLIGNLTNQKDHAQSPSGDLSPGFLHWNDAELRSELARSNIWIFDEIVGEPEHQARGGCKLFDMLLDAQKRERKEDQITKHHYLPRSPVLGFRRYANGYLGFGYVSINRIIYEGYLSGYELLLDPILRLQVGADYSMSPCNVYLKCRHINVKGLSLQTTRQSFLHNI
jgi:hypothetical protein